jgi:hypothetical protein
MYLSSAVTSGGPVAGTKLPQHALYYGHGSGDKEEKRNQGAYVCVEWGEEPLCLKTLCRKKLQIGTCEISVPAPTVLTHLQLKNGEAPICVDQRRSRVRVGVISMMKTSPCMDEEMQSV